MLDSIIADTRGVAQHGKVEPERAQGVTFLGTRPDRPSDRDGLLAQHTRLVEAGQQHHDLAEPGHGPRTLGRGWFGRDRRDRLAVRLQRPVRVAEHVQRAPELLEQHAGPEWVVRPGRSALTAARRWVTARR